MQCPFCQTEMGNAQTACPHCQRPHSPYVAYYLAKGWNDIKRNAVKDATAAFTEATRVTPPADKQQLQSYVSYLVAQAGTSEAIPARHAQAAAAQAATPLAPAAMHPPTVGAITPRPQGGHPSFTFKRALFLNFNEKPINIIRVMDDAKRQQADFAAARSRRVRLIALLFPAGLPFILFDLILGYNICTFSLLAFVMWGAALVGLILFTRDRPTGNEFGSKFDTVRTILESIQDDISPKRTAIGWLDLTGPQQDGKIARKAASLSGMKINHYRDEWLRLKMALYDGNVLRLSAIERVKARLGRWKRGRSGKTKWKAGGPALARSELRVAITVNPQAYELLPIRANQVGKFNIAATPGETGRVVFVATTAVSPLNNDDILQVLRFAYSHLKPRQISAAKFGGLGG